MWVYYLHEEGFYITVTGIRGQMLARKDVRNIFFAVMAETMGIRVDVYAGKLDYDKFLTGFITDNARAHGVKVPVNDQVLAMVKAIEAGQCKNPPDNLAQIRI